MFTKVDGKTIEVDVEYVSRLVTRGDGYAFLTAWRAELDQQDNYARLLALRQDLNVLGCAVLLVSGVYDGHHEFSFMAIGIGADDAIGLGKKWGQESVLLPDALVFCADGSRLRVKARAISASNPSCDHSVIYVDGQDITHVVYIDGITAAA